MSGRPGWGLVDQTDPNLVPGVILAPFWSTRKDSGRPDSARIHSWHWVHTDLVDQKFFWSTRTVQSAQFDFLFVCLLFVCLHNDSRFFFPISWVHQKGGYHYIERVSHGYLHAYSFNSNLWVILNFHLLITSEISFFLILAISKCDKHARILNIITIWSNQRKISSDAITSGLF